MDDNLIPMLNKGDTSSVSEVSLIASESKSYKLRKWSVIVVGCLCYLIGYFHRFTPAVLSNYMAKDFGVAVSDLGIFSSMFFWSYGLLQPFIGSLADIVEPGYTIGVCTILASLGSLICGASKTLTVCCIGRIIVGVGCSAIFVSLNKIAANWFSPKEFRIFAGASIGVGGCGSLLSQSPLEMLGAAVGWRNCFYIVAAVGSVFGVLSLIFVRGHPSKFGFPCQTSAPVKRQFGESIKQVFVNLGIIARMDEFWLIGAALFFGPGIYMDVSGMWGVPYLTDVLGYTNSRASQIQMSLSLSVIIGSPLIPIIAELVGRRKITMIVFALISICTVFVFIFVNKISMIPICILFFLFGFGSTASQGVLMGFLKELGNSSIEGTLIGCGNAFCFIGGAITQNLSSGIINALEHMANVSLPVHSIIIGLWGLTLVAMVMFVFIIPFLRE